MYTFKGKSVFGGWAIGKIKVLYKGEQQVNRTAVKSADKEMERFLAAKKTAACQLKLLYEQVLREVGKTDAAIFQIHQMLLEDAYYLHSIEKIIREQKVNAEFAISETTEKVLFMFASVDNAYLRSRTADVKDISRRLITILSGEEEYVIDSDEPVIVIADDLSPSETVQLDRDKILAFVTVHGAPFSHTAILARTMNVPLIIKTDIPLDPGLNDKTGVLDGSEGILYIDPNPEFITEIQNVMNTAAREREKLNILKGLDNKTLDGRVIRLDANICHAKDVVNVMRNDADGIGMFRSEFLFLEKNTFPSEDEQFEEYKSVAEIMGKDKPCVIRTLDIGADKQLPYLPLTPEENPAMGLRSIRICLRYPNIFETQLKAIYRASVYGQIEILYPMITSVEELKTVLKFSETVRQKVIIDGYDVGKVSHGIMIETPAAVMMSDLLANEVDFFNIGTNDLAQYAMAADRQNPELDEYFEPFNPALLRMIKQVADNAKKKGVRVEICGELATNASLTGLFIALGVDGLSVPPSMILPLRKVIRELDITKIQKQVKTHLKL